MLSAAPSLLFLGHLITTHEYNEMINCLRHASACGLIQDINLSYSFQLIMS